jgi:hypothetical protein
LTTNDKFNGTVDQTPLTMQATLPGNITSSVLQLTTTLV